MYPIGFSKSRAEQLISVIGEGQDIPAPNRGWSCDEMLQVAGALLFAAMSQGRPDIDKDPSQNVASKNGDMTTNALCDSLHMAIDFYSDLTMMVCGGSYDERFEPTLQGVVLRDGGERAFKIVEGAKHE
jgi:hypothetical protein